MSLPSVLDPAQLKRIESTHRGFFYQHVFAVGCLLLAQQSGVTSVDVERDEDLELEFTDSRAYVQVKTRKDQLDWHDIESTVEAFKDIRTEHESGNRSGAPTLYVVCNVAPGKGLLKRYQAEDWGSDVQILWPSCEDTPDFLPAIWPNINAGVDWCIQLANKIPFGTVAGDILFWKLAAMVQFACTGDEEYDHSFSTDRLPELFNQVVIQLQSFPDTPVRYVPHSNEPPYDSEARFRIISGLSGAGKTAWMSEASLQLAESTIYFDIGDTPSAAIAASLVRECTARLFPSESGERQSILLPGYTGVESLRALDLTLAKRQIPLTVFLDNGQQANADQILQLENTTSHLKWIIAFQPCPAHTAVVGRLGVTNERLQGWDTDTIGSRFNAAGLQVEYETADSVRSLTDGLPLFVQSILNLSKELYDGDVRACCAEVQEGAHASTTVQDVIVNKIRTRLSKETCNLVGAVGLSEIGLRIDEIRSLADSGLGMSKRAVGKSLRELQEWGLTQHMRSQELVLHDAFSPLVSEAIGELGDDIVLAVRTTLNKLLYSSLKKNSDHLRQKAFLKLLPLIGETETLIDVATNESEYLRELGLIPELSITLRKYVDAPDSNDRDKFYALDTLALWANDEKDLTSFNSVVDELEVVFEAANLGSKERCALATKRLLRYGRKGDAKAILAEMEEVEALVNDDPELRRILVYDCGAALFYAKDYTSAVKIAESVAAEYFEELEFTAGLASQNLPEIMAGIKQSDRSQSDLHRLADCLELLAIAGEKIGRTTFPARLHAHKFYILAGAYRSAMRVGQDCADELLRLAPNAWESRNFIEQSLLWAVREYKLLEYIVPVRIQHALTVAYCGDIEFARKEMRTLKQFELDNELSEELLRQTELVEKIANGYDPFGDRHAAIARRRATSTKGKGRSRKVGRNAPCPCGSGKKYKKCCLRAM